MKRSREEWRGLFEAHAASGLTEKAFCEKRGLCPKHFNLRKKQPGWVRKQASLMEKSAAPAFVWIAKALSKEAPRIHAWEPRVVLRMGALRMGAAGDE